MCGRRGRRAAQFAYLNHSWLLGHLVKMLLLQGTWAEAGEAPLRTRLASGRWLWHKRWQGCCLRSGCEGAWAPSGRLSLHEQWRSSDWVLHQPAPMGRALPRHLAGHTGTAELLLGSVLVRPSPWVLAAAEADDATDVSIYDQRKKRAMKGCSTCHKRTG